MFKVRALFSLLKSVAKWHREAGRKTVGVFSRPNGVPVTADAQGTPRDTYFKQSPRVTVLDM